MRLKIACIVGRFCFDSTQFKSELLICMSNTNAFFMRFYVEKKRTPQRRMSLKINLTLRYPDSHGRKENEPCLDSYQIRYLEPEHDS